MMSPPDYSMSVAARTESRGKFSRAPDFHYTMDKNTLLSNKSTLLLSRSLQPKETAEEQFVAPTPKNVQVPANKEDIEAVVSCQEGESVDGKVDRATQTDGGDWDWLPALQHYTLTTQHTIDADTDQHLPPSHTQRDVDQPQHEGHKLPLIEHFPRPPSAESTATQSSWMSEEADRQGLPRVHSQPFNRSQAMKQFHSTYTEQPPDLRELAIRDGKKHVFNGFHAYYWH